jgi:hypothetical protein
LLQVIEHTLVRPLARSGRRLGRQALQAAGEKLP